MSETHPTADPRYPAPSGMSDRVSIELYREALENATDAIGMSTPEGRHYYQNPAFTELFGDVGDYPPDRVFCDRELGEKVFRIIMAGGRWVGEERMFARDGRVLDIHLRAYANKDRGGRIVSLVGIHTDMTARKQSEKMLAATNEQLNATLNALPDLLFEIDGHGRILTYRAPKAELLYAPPESFLGRSMFDVLPPDATEVIRRALAEAAVNGVHRGATYALALPDGVRWFELSIAMKEAARAPQARFIMLARDITDRKLAEEALIRLNEDLERRVAERTALAEKRAELLRRLAGQLVQTEQQERRRIAAVLHEDLQQTLAGAQYHLHALRPLDPPRVGEVENLLREALQTSSSLTVELSPSVLYEGGLDAALSWLARTMGAKHGLEVRTDFRTRVPNDRAGMAEFLFRSVRELLFNVVKHAETREALVEMARDEAGRVTVTVSDRGRGFDAIHSAASDTGFGLFEIRERIRNIGGALEIESRPGAGARIRLSVPIENGAGDADDAPRQGGKPAG